MDGNDDDGGNDDGNDDGSDDGNDDGSDDGNDDGSDDGNGNDETSATETTRAPASRVTSEAPLRDFRSAPSPEPRAYLGSLGRPSTSPPRQQPGPIAKRRFKLAADALSTHKAFEAVAELPRT